MFNQFEIEINEIRDFVRQIANRFVCEKIENIAKHKDTVSANYDIKMFFPICWSRFNLLFVERPYAWVGFEAGISFSRNMFTIHSIKIMRFGAGARWNIILKRPARTEAVLAMKQAGTTAVTLAGYCFESTSCATLYFQVTIGI